MNTDILLKNMTAQYTDAELLQRLFFARMVRERTKNMLVTSDDLYNAFHGRILEDEIKKRNLYISSGGSNE
jgi:hypothetical protein